MKKINEDEQEGIKMTEKRGSTEKQSTIKNIIFTHRYLLKDGGVPYYWISAFFVSIFNIFIFFAEVYLPAFVIQRFRDSRALSSILLGVFCYLFCLRAVDLLVKRVERDLDKKIGNARMLRAKDYYALSLNLDYERIDTENYRIKFEKGLDSYYDGFHTGFHHILFDCRALFTGVLGLIVFLVYSSDIHVAMTCLILLSSLITLALYGKNSRWIKEKEEERQKIESKMNHIFKESLSFKNAKDVRFYPVLSLFRHEWENLNARRREWSVKEAKKTALVKFAERALTLFKTLLLFHVIFKRPDITAEHAVVLIGLMAGMERWLKNIFDSLKFLQRNAIHVGNTREVLESTSEGRIDAVAKDAENSLPSIEFVDVSYSFRETGVQAFQHFHLKIPYGEKLAIVGNNGAGKTTLIKLLCGLYQPTAGKILFGGEEIRFMPRELLFRKISAVFQDFNLLAAPIAENISCSDRVEEEKLKEVLEQAGLSEKIRSLSDGVRTELTKEVSSDGILLSGGQNQKLLMARCLYKDAPIVILDEPTAALDALAESELYESYSSLFDKKTVLFISHRLSSTKFCDRIILLQDGAIAEEGTHDELLKKNGKYAQMYRLQSSYYEE